MRRVIDVAELHVRRSTHFMLRVRSLALYKGEILCIVGPNGSGKTTLIECLAGLLKPDAGIVIAAGSRLENNLKVTRRQFGYVPDDENWLIKELCAREYFDLLASVYRSAGVAEDLPGRVAELAKKLFFTNFLQPLEQLSHGNKKKVQLIAALMHKPGIIVVDELRNGLDPLSIIAVEKLLKQERARGACIIAATHDLWWAERIADQVLILVGGAVSYHDTTEHIIQKYGSLQRLFLLTTGRKDDALV